MNERRKILLTSFDGIPSEKQGGPNNIIYKILKHINSAKFSCGFVSYRNYIRNYTAGEDKDISPGIKKRITDYLYYNYRLYRLLTSNNLYLKRHFDLRDAFFLKRSEAEGYDVIHSHDTLSGYYFSKSDKAVKLLTIHGNGSIENDWADAASKNRFVKGILPELKRREIQAFNNADIITFPGKYAKELFLSDYGGKLRKDKDIRIIHNGIDTDVIKKIRPREEYLLKYGRSRGHDAVFFNVAAHVRQKNIEVIIGVIEELVKMKKNPLLINAGVGPLTEDLKSLIRKKNLQSNVKLAGRLGRGEVISLMKLSDAVLMMSDRVIFDIVMLEAAACGARVITALSGGNLEMLGDYSGLIEIKDMSPAGTANLIVKNVYSGAVKKINAGRFKFNIWNMTAGYEKLYSGVYK